MAIINYPLLDAAQLAYHSYNPQAAGFLKPQIKDIMHNPHDHGVQACLLKGDFLLITGSNSLKDYYKNNLRIFRVGKRKLSLKSKDMARDANGRMWHQGFLAYAQEVQNWLGPRKPRLIIGHSLGAAATQILSRTYGVTGFAFASPRVVRPGSSSAKYQYCLNICRTDDPVCYLPASMLHIGRTIHITGSQGGRPVNHKMVRYLDLLTKAKPGQLPKKWPFG